VLPSVVTLALLVVFWRLGQKWLAAPVIVFLILYYVFVPSLVRKRSERFHREALRLLSTGRAAEVPGLARRNLLLQLFGSSGPVDAKLGLAYSQMGRYRMAVPPLESAIPTASETERPALRAGLVKALLVTGDLGRAEAEGRRLLSSGLHLPETLAAVARARVGQGKCDDETWFLLEEAEELSPSDDVALMIDLTRIEMRIRTNRSPGEVPEGAISDQPFLRAWVHLVRGRLKERGDDPEGAVADYREAAAQGAEDSHFAALAQERLERLATGPDSDGASGEVDPAIKRKRRKRR